MILWLTDSQADQVTAHALSDRQREVCGLIAGVEHDGVWGARAIIPIPNCAPDPVHHYHMDERALASALMDIERRGLSLVGIYHSHPQSDPIPSPEDIAQAAYPDTAYLIIGLKSGEAHLSAWRINYGRVDVTALHIGAAPPDLDLYPASGAQKLAIFGAALLTFAFVILLSLSLLPPAPPLPR